MGLIYENVKNGSTSTGKTISDKLGFTDVISVIQNSVRETSDKLDIKDSACASILPGILKEVFSFDDKQSAEIITRFNDDLDFNHAISAYIETVVQTSLSFNDICSIIDGIATTISDTFSLTDALSVDIIKSLRDKAYLESKVIANLQTQLSDSFAISDNNSTHLTSKTEDNVSITDSVFVIFDQARPIGAPIAIGNKLIG